MRSSWTWPNLTPEPPPGGRDTSNIKASDAGAVLADVLRGYMSEMKIENGLSALGYTSADVDNLVKGTLPQVR